MYQLIGYSFIGAAVALLAFAGKIAVERAYEAGRAARDREIKAHAGMTGGKA